MRFDQRELRPYCEPVSPGLLARGSVYFTVSYLDEHLLIPTVQALVFVRSEIVGPGPERFLFQDAESYRQGRPEGMAAGLHDATFVECTALELNGVFEFEKALEELMRCSLRRTGQVPGTPVRE